MNLSCSLVKTKQCCGASEVPWQMWQTANRALRKLASTVVHMLTRCMACSFACLKGIMTPHPWVLIFRAIASRIIRRSYQHGSPLLHTSGSCLLQSNVLHGRQLLQHVLCHWARQPAPGRIGLLLLRFTILQGHRKALYWCQTMPKQGARDSIPQWLYSSLTGFWLALQLARHG